MSELDDIRGFIEVVEAGGFSRAATRLGLSKSIISRRVTRLEETLGTQLLTRTTRGISPTDAGLEFKARAERALVELEEARDAVMHDRGQLTGRLRVSAPLSFGIAYLSPLVIDLARRHPRLDIDISYSDRRVDLVSEGFDLALRIGQLKDSTLVARRICPVHAVVVASAAYLAARGEPRVPADLARHDCILYSSAANAEWAFQSGKRRMPFRPQGRLRTDSGEAMLHWVEAGLGIAVLPVFLCDRALAGGSVRTVLDGFPLPPAALYAVRPPGAHPSRKVRTFIDAVIDRFGGGRNWSPGHGAVAPIPTGL